MVELTLLLYMTFNFWEFGFRSAACSGWMFESAFERACFLALHGRVVCCGVVVVPCLVLGYFFETSL